MNKIRKSAVLICILILLFTGVSIFVYLQYGRQTDPVAQSASPVPTATAEQGNYVLEIPEIGISVPIALNVNGADQDAYNQALEGGVAQLLGTALPGHSGNTFIFGHSSFYTSAEGNYKEVFKDLNDLEEGNELTISNSASTFTYQVTDKQIVSPDRVDLTAQIYTKKQLTLMTCWPIGTDKERLVVISNLVSQK